MVTAKRWQICPDVTALFLLSPQSAPALKRQGRSPGRLVDEAADSGLASLLDLSLIAAHSCSSLWASSSAASMRALASWAWRAACLYSATASTLRLLAEAASFCFKSRCTLRSSLSRLTSVALINSFRQGLYSGAPAGCLILTRNCF
jgi:hypothetical protein